MPVDELQRVKWLPIAGFPRYLIGDNGKVRSLRKNGPDRILIGGRDKDGYRKVILCENGVKRHARVHILVLEAFTGWTG